jgi:hypothetical protein
MTDISMTVTGAVTLQGLCALQEPLSGIPLAAEVLSQKNKGAVNNDRKMLL